jgi:hypothetical protein
MQQSIIKTTTFEDLADDLVHIPWLVLGDIWVSPSISLKMAVVRPTQHYYIQGLHFDFTGKDPNDKKKVSNQTTLRIQHKICQSQKLPGHYHGWR